MKSLFETIDALQKEINEHRPFDLPMRAQIKEYFRISLTYTSNALEGNSLTESETKIVLEEGITIGGKRLVDHMEAIGHSDAYDYLYKLIDQKQLGEAEICALHHLFYYRIDEKNAGVYRRVKVFITGSSHAFPPPAKVPEMMAEFVAAIDAARANKHPVEFAAWLHKEFVYIHPFIDGNGRVARLLMNLALMQAGFTIAIIPPILRAQYIAALEKGHTNDRDFIMFIANVVKETQRDFLRLFGA